VVRRLADLLDARIGADELRVLERISIVVAFLLATAPSMPSFAVFSSAMAVATVVDSVPSFARQVEVEVQQSWTMELGVTEPDASK